MVWKPWRTSEGDKYTIKKREKAPEGYMLSETVKGSSADFGPDKSILRTCKVPGETSVTVTKRRDDDDKNNSLRLVIQANLFNLHLLYYLGYTRGSYS